MKKSKTKLPHIKAKVKGQNSKGKSRVMAFAFTLLTIFALTLVFVSRFSASNQIENGSVKFTATLLTEPKVYDRWQYFDINGYSVRASSDQRLSYGDRLAIEGVAKENKLTEPKIEIVGSSKWQKNLFDLRESLRAKISAALPEPQAALLAGVLLGANEELPADFKEALRKTGTIHVVVVSGYNISVVAGFLIGLSKFIKRQYATFLGLVVIAFYTLLVGANAPAVRAAIMCSAAFFATLLGRQRFPLYFLALAALIMLLIKPTVIGDIGFQLSFLATAGIILFQNKIFQPLKLLPKPFGDDLSTTLAAQSLVVPVLFYHFGSVSAISPVVNAVSLWIIPLVTILGFVFLAVSFAVPFIAAFLAWILWVFLTIFVFLVEGFGKLSFAYFSFSQGMIWPALFYYVALGLFIFYLKYGRVARRKQS